MNTQGLISRNDLDVARANAESARAKLEQARASVTQAQARASGASAQIQQSRAQLAQAEAEIGPEVEPEETEPPHDPNPVIVLEHKLLYKTSGPVTEAAIRTPIGVSHVAKHGKSE